MPKNIEIIWERLVENGETCPRCKETELELEEAVKLLKNLLISHGIKVKLEKIPLSKSEFIKNPLISNRILINGKPMEELLKATVGKSPCCDVCGPTECRTLEIGDETYEKVPKELIISAVLKEAKDFLL